MKQFLQVQYTVNKNLDKWTSPMRLFRDIPHHDQPNTRFVIDTSPLASNVLLSAYCVP